MHIITGKGWQAGLSSYGKIIAAIHKLVIKKVVLYANEKVEGNKSEAAETNTDKI